MTRNVVQLAALIAAIALFSSPDLWGGPRGRHRAHRGGERGPSEEVLAEFDVDGDGELSVEEREAAKAARQAEREAAREARLLEKFDEDGDGALSDDELAAAEAAREEHRARRHHRRPRGRSCLFQQFDTDGDGALNDAEREAAGAIKAQLIERFDADSDGGLDKEERAAARDALCPDDDGDDVVEAGEGEDEGEGDAAEDGDLLVAALLAPPVFLRGDATDDGRVDISDSIAVLGFLFLGGSGPSCMDVADANDDGFVNISDPTSILATLFQGESLLAEPYPDVGSDPTPDDLVCSVISEI